MSKLFIDSSFLVALFRENDDNHDIAVKNSSILLNEECYISNGIITEVVTVLMKRTKNTELTVRAYYFMNDNFKVIEEYEINEYNEKVFSVFRNYNVDSDNVSFIDCSSVVISNHFSLDYVVSLDKGFRLFNEIELYPIDM